MTYPSAPLQDISFHSLYYHFHKTISVFHYYYIHFIMHKTRQRSVLNPFKKLRHFLVDITQIYKKKKQKKYLYFIDILNYSTTSLTKVKVFFFKKMKWFLLFKENYRIKKPYPRIGSIVANRYVAIILKKNYSISGLSQLRN